MPQIGGKPKVSKTTKTPKKKSSSSTTKRHFTVVIGSKEHGLYISSSPSSAARKAISKLCATDKKRKVQFHIREITQGSKKKTYGPYLGYIEKLAKPIELKGRVIKYKPVAKLSGKTGKKSAVKKGGMRGGINLSNKKGGMERTGASSASNSKKRIYPGNLHEVKSREELLSLITWLQCVKNEYESIRSSHQRNRSNHYEKSNIYPNYKDRTKNLNPNRFNAFSTREELRRHVLRMLGHEFEDIPYDSEELNYLINYIINDEESGFGPYADKEYFVNIWKNALQMRETHGSDSHNDWEPEFDNKNFDLWFGSSGRDFIHEEPHYLDIYNK